MAELVTEKDYYDAYKRIPETWKTKGINLIYFGDFHHRKEAPANRIDDFHKTELNKVKQIKEIAHQYNAKALLQPGDFLDKPRFDDHFLNQVMQAWGYPEIMEARKLFEAGKISKDEYIQRTLDYVPIVGLAGNHELYGGSYKTLKRTSLNFLAESGFINLVDKEHPYLIQDAVNQSTIAIRGLNYDSNLLKDKTNFELQDKLGDVDIFMVHEALYNTELTAQMNWMPITEIWNDTKADITIAGHIHNGFGWVKHNGKFFGNPGCPAQQSSSKNELDKQINVTLIHIEGAKFQIRNINLDTPKSRDIFDLSKKDDKIALDKQLAKVKETLSAFKNEDNQISETEIIKNVANNTNVTKEVRDLAIEETLNSKKNLNLNEFSIKQDVDYTISKLILDNFESHAHTEIDLAKAAPTLLIGESSQGKSSVLRALYWILENVGDTKQFVRRYPGVLKCSVTLIRNDGYQVTRFTELSKTRKRVVANGYRFKTPDGEETESNTEAVSVVQQIFGFNYLLLDNREKVPLNFLKQEDGWFFIGDSPAKRAKIIGSLYGTQYLIDAAKNLNSQNRTLNSQLKVVNEDIANTNTALSTLNKTEEHQQIVNNLRDKLDEYKQNIKTYDDNKNIYNNLIYNKKQIQVCDYKLTHSQDTLAAITDTMNNLKLNQMKFNSLKQSFNQRVAAIKQIKQVSPMINIKYQSLFDSLKQLQHNCELYNNLKNQYNSLCKSRKIMEFQIPDVNEVSQRLNQLKQNQQAFDTNKQIYNKRCQAVTTLKELSPIVEIDKTVSEVKKLLNDLDKQQNNFENLKQVYNQKIAVNKKVKELQQTLTELKKQQSDLETHLQHEKERLGYHPTTLPIFDAVNGTWNYVKIYNKPEGDIVTMENQTISTLTERLEKIKEKVEKAKTEKAVAENQKATAEKQLQEAGIDPENARQQLLDLKAQNDKDEKFITEKLDEMEKVFDDNHAAN